MSTQHIGVSFANVFSYKFELLSSIEIFKFQQTDYRDNAQVAVGLNPGAVT